MDVGETHLDSPRYIFLRLLLVFVDHDLEKWLFFLINNQLRVRFWENAMKNDGLMIHNSLSNSSHQAIGGDFVRSRWCDLLCLDGFLGNGCGCEDPGDGLQLRFLFLGHPGKCSMMDYDLKAMRDIERSDVITSWDVHHDHSDQIPSHRA